MSQIPLKTRVKTYLAHHGCARVKELSFVLRTSFEDILDALDALIDEMKVDYKYQKNSERGIEDRVYFILDFSEPIEEPSRGEN